MEHQDAEMFDEAFWNERYRAHANAHGELWSGNPNPHLVAQASDLAPGSALDVGCGEGADAIWLAARGWRVTGVDVSTVALERATARATAAGDEIAGRTEWLHRDLLAWTPDPASYDLVSAQYLHLPPSPRTALFTALAAAVTPGGTLLVVGHHPSDLDTTIPRPSIPELFFTSDDVTAVLDPDAWEIVVNDAPGRPATDPEGRTVTIHDTVLRARRRA